MNEVGLRATWTQAICDNCYVKRKGQRTPVRSKDGSHEQCCDCGQATTSGIYIREDPTQVRFPRMVTE